MGRTALDDQKIPPMRDPRWKTWAEPLWAHLSAARTWPELEAWADAREVQQDILRHLLAWLTLRGRAFWDFGTRTWKRRKGEVHDGLDEAWRRWLPNKDTRRATTESAK